MITGTSRGDGETAYITRDGVWTVEVVTLTMTAAPSQLGDPPGDGTWLCVKRHGFQAGYVATPAELAQFFPIDQLEER